ncbi:hypothetical protein LZC95_36625 [Pendulispora brunnea]|uniref:Metallo-mystery pair system four-Cys motif protein n=1 Tax=Pendulispora brunnea TaxID=2905690 RepID=A0ABZ2JZP0_9BACT
MYASILQYARSLRVSRLAGAGIAASLAVVLGAAGCDQSTPLCRTGTGTYTIKYNLVAGSGDCANLKADIVYVNSYNDVGEEGKPDLEKVSAALMPKRFAEYLDRAEFPDQLAAWGHFTNSEPSGNVCNIPTLTETTKAFPALDAIADDGDSPFADDDNNAGRSAEVARTVSYKWSNWQVYFTAAHAGNAFVIDLDYTVTNEGGAASTCKYQGVGLLFGQRPSCSKNTNADHAKPGNYVAEAARCDSVAHPDLGLGTGSGVDPEANFACDPETLLCLANVNFGGF